MKKLNIVALLLLFLNISFAQKLEIGNVSKAELEEKVHPKDSSAVAAYLFKNGRTYFEHDQNEGFTMCSEVSIRIKIYKKEGYDFANAIVPYYVYKNPEEKISFSKAVTYNLVNGQIEKTKLKSEGEFVENRNKYTNIKKITMPNVKVGSIVEYVYLLRSKYYRSFRDWDFQTEIPVNHSEYTTTIPEYFTYNIHRKGFVFPKETVEKFNNTLNLTIREQDGMIITKFVGYQTVNYNATKTTFVLNDVPALKNEAFVNNIGNYTAGLKYELAMTNFPGETVTQYSQNWESVLNAIHDDPDFTAELNKNNYFEEDLAALKVGLISNEQKIGAIFRYVQNRMNWNGLMGFGCNDGVKKAYSTKTGNIAEINLMLVAMLRAVGLQANPVLASTRSNGIPFFPSISGYNYVMAIIELNNEVILLDASNKNSNPNIIPERALNWTGKVLRADKSTFDVNLMPTKNSLRNVTIICTLDADGSVSGKMREQNFDYNALEFRDSFRNVKEDSYLDDLEKKHSNIEVSNYTIQDKNEPSKPIVETFDFKKTAAVDIIGNKIYFSPLFFLTRTTNPFTQQKREFPVEFGYSFQTKYTISTNLPKGYVVETLPQPVAMLLSDGLGSFKYTIAVQETSIQVLISIEINSPIYPADFYEDLKAFYAEITKKESEKIVLVKG
jgi:hypothetical protein